MDQQPPESTERPKCVRVIGFENLGTVLEYSLVHFAGLQGQIRVEKYTGKTVACVQCFGMAQSQNLKSALKSSMVFITPERRGNAFARRDRNGVDKRGNVVRGRWATLAGATRAALSLCVAAGSDIQLVKSHRGVSWESQWKFGATHTFCLPPHDRQLIMVRWSAKNMS